LVILSLYRPNFCSQCGAKIVRLTWRLWTSRSFCSSCARQFQYVSWLKRSLAGLLLISSGTVIGRALKSSPPPIVIQRTAAVATAGQDSEAPSAAKVTVDDTYLCGARTKKGTPCSRRVHGPTRCWQHKGLPSMLPVEKLKVKD
jgi:hypothetical protein